MCPVIKLVNSFRFIYFSFSKHLLRFFILSSHNFLDYDLIRSFMFAYCFSSYISGVLRTESGWIRSLSIGSTFSSKMWGFPFVLSCCFIFKDAEITWGKVNQQPKCTKLQVFLKGSRDSTGILQKINTFPLLLLLGIRFYATILLYTKVICLRFLIIFHHQY